MQSFQGCSKDPAAGVYDKAEVSLSDGSYSEALEKYSHIISRFQDSPYASKSQYRIASIYNMHLEDKKKAMEAYSAVILMYPGSREAVLSRYDMAAIYSSGGEHRKALEQYQKLLEEDVTQREKTQYLIAMEYMKMNDMRQARIEFIELLKNGHSPDTVPMVRYQIANTYYIEGDIKKAIEEYDGIISIYPDTELAAEAAFGKARALDESGKPREALQVFNSLLGRYPNQEAVRTAIESIKKRLEEGQRKEG